MDEEIHDLCRRACRSASRAGVEAEAFGYRIRETEAEIEAGEIVIGSDGVDSGVGIRILKDGRVGFAYTSVPERIESTVREAMTVSRFGPETGIDLPGFDASDFPDVNDLYSGDVASMEVEEILERTGDLLDGARSVEGAIEVPTGGLVRLVEEYRIMNTRGLDTGGRATILTASVSTVAGEGDGRTSGYEMGITRSPDLDPRGIGHRSAQRALELQDSGGFEGGRMDVILEPLPAAEILSAALIPAMNGERVGTGESFLEGRLGEEVAWRGLTIRDDPTVNGGIGSARCDDEGVPSRNNILLDRGVLKGFLYDLAAGARYGAETTGSGVRGGFRSIPRTSSRNLIVEGEARTKEKLISGIDRGVLVREVLGAHTANPVSTDFSVNSAGIFLIERGEVLHPLRSAMISGTLSDMLKRIVALGDDRRPVPLGAAFELPSFCFEDVQVND